MKKSLFVAVTVLIAVVGCTRSQEMEIQKGDLTLVAKTESSNGSRTIVEDGTHVYWEPGDEIKVFSGDKSGAFRSELTESAATATFNGTLGEGAWTEGMDLWAVYPYSEDAVLDGETIVTVLPDVQVARAGSFGKDMNMAIAHSTTETLQFYNVCGGVRFSLQEGGIKEVVLEGMNGEVLAGTVTVGFEDGEPVIQTVTEGKTSIRLTPEKGESFEKDEWYYFVAISGALEKGFKFHFVKEDDLGYKVFDKKVTIKRGIYGTVSNADDGATYTTVPDDIIVFKDDLVKSILVKYFDTGGDGEMSYREAAVVHSFLVDETETRSTEGKVSIFAGTEIATFDEMVCFTGLTRIDDGAFAGCTELTAVTIPENVASIGDNAFNGCSGLESIILTSDTPPAIGTDAFADTGDCPITVPPGSVDEYVDAWNEYAERIEPGHPYAIPEAVDLGLPSGTLWASFNLGATKPEEPGEYFAWGETTPKDVFSWATYRWCDGTQESLNKYVDKPVTNRYDLEPEDDAAHVKLGGEWRMPTIAERNELYDYCTISPETIDGVSLVKLTSKVNGNSIYLPQTGDYTDTGWTSQSVATFWTSSLAVGSAYAGSCFILTVGTGCEAFGGSHSRCFGFPIRPVQGDFGIPVESFSLAQTELDLFVGETVQIQADILPENATHKGITWQSSNASVVSVSSSGAVKGLTEGNATIWATTHDGNLRAYCNVSVTPYTYTAETPEVVDLGLPSGLKWASFNLGATAPEEYGDYFAWGETEPYYFGLDPLSWKEGKERGYVWSSYKWCMGLDKTMTKYCVLEEYGYNGFTDGKTVLEPEDDAASVNLGDGWRIPTADEQQELIDNCSWELTTENGVSGILFIGPNGNRIFLPAAGELYIASQGLLHGGTRAYYWSSSVQTFAPSFARDVFTGSSLISGYCSRFYGQSIRPVYDDRPSTMIETFTPTNIGPCSAEIPFSISTDESVYDFGIIYSTNRAEPVVGNLGEGNYMLRISSDVGSSMIIEELKPNTTYYARAFITIDEEDGEKMYGNTIQFTTDEIAFSTDYQDLGLSVSWATCNLGSSSPSNVGGYYCWGETIPSSVRTGGYQWSGSGGFTKYNETDGKVTLEPSDDAAYVNLGEKWRIPTKEELAELRDNCTWTPSTLDGVKGCTVTGPNGKSIFIPVSEGTTGSFEVEIMSSSLITVNGKVLALLSYYDRNGVNFLTTFRYWGIPIRPVYDERTTTGGNHEGTDEEDWN